MSVVLVYDVAASASGALSILKGYYEHACMDTGTSYVFIISTPYLEQRDNVRIARYPWIKKSLLHRYFFDCLVASRVVSTYHPDKIVSLQNLVIPHVKQAQTVYVQNSIPKCFCDYHFSPLKETNLWLRQLVLGPKIEKSLKHADAIITQTEWMKERCVNRLGIPESRIAVRNPSTDTDAIQRYTTQGKVSFLYPATALPYKNHKLIVNACELLKKSHPGLDYSIFFTLSGDETREILSMKKAVENEALPIEFIGRQSQDELAGLYAKSVLLFPSLLESWGLPLSEARAAGSPILAANLPYAREVLEGYQSARFFDPDNPIDLSRCISSCICQQSLSQLN